MKKKAISVLLAAVLLCIPVLPVFAAPAYLYPMPEGTVENALLIGHRGLSACAPENTLAAFRLAGSYGMYGAECDIQLTSDGSWIVMHDATLDRMTDGTGRVADRTLEEIRALKIDAGNGLEQYPNERVPTLEEYLTVCESCGLRSFIELKDVSPRDLASLPALLGRFESSGSIVFLSFDRELVTEIKRLLPRNTAMLISLFGQPSDLNYCTENGLDGVDLCFPLTPHSRYTAALRSGLQAAAWTADEPDNVRELTSLGVRWIATNALVPAHAPEGEQRSVNVFTGLIAKIKNLYHAILDAAADFIRNRQYGN